MSRILILHGWGSSQKKWVRVKEILIQRGNEVFVPDLPGFGENPPPKAPWGVDDYVEWVKNYTKNFAPFFLLGHSFGGRLAIKFALKYPENILGLILLAVPAIKSKRQSSVKNFVIKIFARFSFLPFYRFLRKIFYLYFLRKTDYFQINGVMKETFKKIIGEDLSFHLPLIKTKTLILWGEKDDYVSMRVAFLIKEKIPDSKLMIFPGVKHSPYLEIPEKLAEIIIQFTKS
jgi:pimeloyl-ACP methyl ester carboxylesterase